MMAAEASALPKFFIVGGKDELLPPLALAKPAMR